MRILALLTAAVLAISLAACGGDDSTSTSTQATTAQGEGETTTPGSKSSPQQGEGSAGSDEAGGSGGSGQGASSHAVTPLQVSGGGSAQFRSKGGDNSVQEFGEEGDESELQEAAETVHTFYVARISEEWARACSYLSSSEMEQLEQLATQLEVKGCARTLDAFTRPLSGSLQREITTIDAASLRHEGEQAFLIYVGAPDRTVYAMPMQEEDGAWKVSALNASALP
jgi:hypothetical protein